MAERQALSAEDFFSTISKNDLKGIGLGDVAYLRRYVISGHQVFVLHAADGSALSVEDNESILKQDAGLQELSLVTVH